MLKQERESVEKFSNNPNNSYNQPEENTEELQVNEINQAETVSEEQPQQPEVEQTVEKKKSGKKIIAVGAVALVAAIGIGVAKMNSDKDTPGTTVTENEPGTSDQETDNGLEPGNTYTIEGNKNPYEKYLSEDSLSIEEICEEVDEENMANAIFMKTGNVEEFLRDWFIRNGYDMIISDSGINNTGEICVSASGSFRDGEKLGVEIYQDSQEEFQLLFIKMDLNDITNGETTKVVMSQIPTAEQAKQIFEAIYGE